MRRRYGAIWMGSRFESFGRELERVYHNCPKMVAGMALCGDGTRILTQSKENDALTPVLTVDAR